MTDSALLDTARFARLRRGVAARRTASADRRALQRDLASYTSEAEVNDLLSTLQGASERDAEAVRSILLGNLAARRAA